MKGKAIAVGVRILATETDGEWRYFIENTDIAINPSDNGIDPDINHWDGIGDTDNLVLFLRCIIGLVIDKRGEPPYRNMELAMVSAQKQLKGKFGYTGEIRVFY